ncbi:MAG: hypothetical protein IKT93_05025 [Clostridia bacterium]|nr:hypothetical protein [Clostridia bacterium]
MGTINYFTSDYITLGYNTNNINYDDEFYSDDINFEFDEIAAILRNEFFYYFHITLKPGYYEGFSIDIENNFKYCFDNYGEKLQALKEVTRIKNFMLYIIDNFNVSVVFPGWCTGYGDYKETTQKINAAIKEMKSEIKTTPTYYNLKIAGEV